MSDKPVKPKTSDLVKSLQNSGVINAKTTVEDILRVSRDLSDGGGVNSTIVYDDDKYFAIMK